MSVLTLSGNEIDWRNPPKATDQTIWSRDDWSGRTVKGSLRTIAHLDQMNSRAENRYDSPIVIIQPPYNTSVPASAGTHDFDCCLDWYIPGVDWWEQQRFGRANGQGCWYRKPPLFGNHVHGFTLPVPRGSVRSDDFAIRVGVYVPGQLIDYYNRAFGLSGQHTPGSDRSWFPANIDATVFDLNRYIQIKQEDFMEYKDWSGESKKALAHDVAQAVLAAGLNESEPGEEGFDGKNVRWSLKRATEAK